MIDENYLQKRVSQIRKQEANGYEGVSFPTLYREMRDSYIRALEKSLDILALENKKTVRLSEEMIKAEIKAAKKLAL